MDHTSDNDADGSGQRPRIGPKIIYNQSKNIRLVRLQTQANVYVCLLGRGTAADWKLIQMKDPLRYLKKNAKHLTIVHVAYSSLACKLTMAIWLSLVVSLQQVDGDGEECKHVLVIHNP